MDTVSSLYAVHTLYAGAPKVGGLAWAHPRRGRCHPFESHSNPCSCANSSALSAGGIS